MSTDKVGFYKDLTNIIFQLSANTHLITSSETHSSLNFVNHHISSLYYIVLWIFEK